jgi:hypothetical protein
LAIQPQPLREFAFAHVRNVPVRQIARDPMHENHLRGNVIAESVYHLSPAAADLRSVTGTRDTHAQRTTARSPLDSTKHQPEPPHSAQFGVFAGGNSRYAWVVALMVGQHG